MIRWYEPIDPADWIKRSVSLPNLIVLFLSALILFSELRFDWCEQMIGRYLASLNYRRPEIGTVWKRGERASRAHAYLDARAEDLQNAARHAREVSSFAQLAETIPAGQWTLLDKDLFRNLYFSLPDTAASELIPAVELLWLYKEGRLERIFCSRSDTGLDIFFLDSGNQVIRSIGMDRAHLQTSEAKPGMAPGTLDEMPEFAGRIYPAQRFFSALVQLPDEIIPDLIPFPERLLREQGTIVRAGIGNEATGGYIRLGFEFQRSGDSSVVFVKAREWAVWRLGMMLTGGRE